MAVGGVKSAVEWPQAWRALTAKAEHPVTELAFDVGEVGAISVEDPDPCHPHRSPRDRPCDLLRGQDETSSSQSETGPGLAARPGVLADL
jgi:hypothetical protein